MKISIIDRKYLQDKDSCKKKDLEVCVVLHRLSINTLLTYLLWSINSLLFPFKGQSDGGDLRIRILILVVVVALLLLIAFAMTFSVHAYFTVPKNSTITAAIVDTLF